MVGIPDGGILPSIHHPHEGEEKINEVFNTIKDPFFLMSDCEDNIHKPQQQQEHHSQEKSESCPCQQTVREIHHYDIRLIIHQ